MFGFICTFFPEELISIPSSKRAGIIHHKLFEKKGKYEVTFMTMDCRKWAPRSSPEKYIYMIMGMSDVLPDDFVKSVVNYFLRHEKKQIHSRKKIVDVFLSNPQNEKYRKYFKYDNEKDSAYFEMNYSFVMGIFNYLSSLMHVGGQYLTKYIVEKTLGMNGVVCVLDFVGHSDDSCGRCLLSDKQYVPFVLSKHEQISKLINHLMSAKKCVTSEMYMEFLSILYINNQFLPLISKFVQNISFIPSGKGLSVDFKTIISKSIELLTNGGSITMAYYVQIIMSNMYRNFYRVNWHSLPPALGGFVDSMPQLYLSFGSNIDEYRFYRYDKPMFMKYIDCMLTEMDCSFEDGMPILKYERRERVPHHFEIFEKIELPEFEDNEWFFAQNKTRNSLMNLFWMKAMTKDENFAISLLQQNDIKRFLDTLLMASGNAVKTVLGNTNVNTLINSIVNREVTDSMRNQNLVSLLNSQYSTCSDYYDFLEGHPDFNPVVKVQHTDKPCVLNITRYNSIPLIDKDTLTLSVHICRPELKKYLNSGYEFGMELKALENYIHSMNVPMNIKSIHAFITYLKKNVNKTAHIYASMPGDSRNLYDESGLHSYLIHNFHPKLTIRETSYRFINKSPIARLTTDFDNTIKDWMTALCLRRSVIYSRLEYLNQLVLNKKNGL